MSLATGEVFAGYTVIRLLGAGGMGEVYLARHPRLPRQDALKVLPESVSSDEEFRARFEREADTAAALWHPHIIRVHDRGDFNGRLWIAMDYADGTDVAELLADEHSEGMPPATVAEIVTAVAEALDYAHDRGLLHRDVKPANILLTVKGNGPRRVLLAGFGIARQADDDSGTTRTNMTVGSVLYTAPEQLMGEALDGRADQYALAATAFHLLTGHPPFKHTNPAVVISRHLSTLAPAASTANLTLKPFDAAVSRALAKNARQRYPSCGQFAAAFAEAASGISARSPEGDGGMAPLRTSGATHVVHPAEPTTLLKRPPVIDGSPTPEIGLTSTTVPRSPDSAASRPSDPPVVVSSWGDSQAAAPEEQLERLILTPAGSTATAGPDFRSPTLWLLVTGAVLSVCVVAIVTFSVLSGREPQAAPDITPTTITDVGPTRAPAATSSPATRSTSIPTATRSTTTAAAPEPAARPTGRNYTIVDYIRDNGIGETPVFRGDPGVPIVDLPFPPGWRDAGTQTPDWAFGAIIYEWATSYDQPTVIAILSKLTGDVDPARILEYAPAELYNLPGFSGGDSTESSLDGFSAVQVGGSYIRDGAQRAIAQKTVVIPGQGGLYVLQLNADGLYADIDILMRATTVIDEQAIITP